MFTKTKPGGDERRKALIRAAREKGVAPPETSCIWPKPYNELTVEAGYGFLTECWWTDNDTEGTVILIPAKDYIREFVREWVECYIAKVPLVIEKSRRIVVSWCCRGLECWVMGLSRSSAVIIDQVHQNSAEHLWRIDFSLNQLYDRRPSLKIPKHSHRGSRETKDVRAVIMANGSLITQGHQEAGSAQGKGKGLVVLEEISKYSAPSEWWGQAMIVAQGTAAGQGGWVCGIANPDMHSGWQEIKGKRSARKVIGLE